MSILDFIFGAGQRDAAKLQTELKAVESAASNEVTTVSQETMDYLRKEALLAQNVFNPSSSKVQRPGDTPPRQFVGKTLEQLQSTLSSYVSERDLLIKDIEKLQEEQKQLNAAIDALQMSVDKLTPAPQQNWNDASVAQANVDAISKALAQ